VEQIRWPRPVRPGDILRAEWEILEVRTSRSKPDRGVVRVRSRMLNQDGDPVMEQVATLIVPRKPVPETGPSAH
jgi:acyl dehydratase